MAKYSYELKKEIVQAYLNNEGGYTYLILIVYFYSGIYKNIKYLL